MNTRIGMVAGIAMMTLLSIGCKTEKKEDSGELQVRIQPTEENLCTQIADVVCHNAFHCCLGADLEGVFGIEITTTEETCRRDVRLICEEVNAQALFSLQKRWVEVDLDLVEECLKWILFDKEKGCFPVEEIDMTSSTIYSQCISTGAYFVGLQTPGQDCLYDHDCAGEAFCDVNRNCRELQSEGEDCTGLYRACRDGLFCGVDYESEDLDVVCQRRAVEGRPCLVHPMYGTVIACATDLYCDVDPDFEEDAEVNFYEQPNGVCTAQKPEADACEANRECESGTCLPGVCQDGSAICFTDDDCSSVCSVSGEPCNATTPCTTSFCAGGQMEDWLTGDIVSVDGNTCFGETDCGGTCSLTPNQRCLGDDACFRYCVGPDGTVTNDTCINDDYCLVYWGEEYTCGTSTCQNAGTCEAETCGDPTPCTGNPVCAANYYVIDYCQRGLYLLHSAHP